MISHEKLKELEMRSLELLGELRDSGYLFAAKWLFERDYIVLSVNSVRNQLNVVAKNPKNGHNECFSIRGQQLEKMVFVNRRDRTWDFEVVFFNRDK